MSYPENDLLLKQLQVDFVHAISSLFPKKEYTIRVVGSRTSIQILFCNMSEEEIRSNGNLGSLNASVRLHLMIHLADGRAKPIIGDTIEMLTCSPGVRSASRFSKFKFENPSKLQERLVKWFAKNRTTFIDITNAENKRINIFN
jgi:hypothetical protein